MNYQITRGGQTYGPYTLADLQRYVASGHVLLTDLAKSDEMAEWIPVSQVLNPSGFPPVPPVNPPVGEFTGGFAPQQPVGAPAYASPYADPPNLNWGLVLLFDLITCGVFQIVWNFVMSAWMKRVQPTSQAILYYAGGYGLFLIGTGVSFPVYIAMMHHTHYSAHPFASLIGIVAWALRLVARFNMRASLEQHYNTVEPMNLQINPVLLFFFGGIYIQSQLNRINEIKRAMRYQNYPR